MEDVIYMREALKEAELAGKEGNWPIGVVIVLEGKIIARAHNSRYTENDVLGHAEMNALQQVKHLLIANQQQAILYTTYEPCPMCFGAIILSRIKRVICGINLDRSGAMYFREHLPKLFKQDKFTVEFETGMLADECAKIFLAGEPAKKLINGGHINTSKVTN